MKSGKSRGQNRFVRIITMPVRALGRARDLYVKGMNSVERRGIGTGMAGPVGQYPGLPKSFSARPSRSGERDDYAELVRAASARTYGGMIDVDAILRQQLRESEAAVAAAAAAANLRKCGSVGMRKIDEDGPCEFAGAEATRAVAKRSVVF